jgi:hypothetical protein
LRCFSSEAVFFAITTCSIIYHLHLEKSSFMSILKKLRRLSRQEASMDDMREFGRQVRLESNDRGAALLVTANTDLALSQAVYRVLKVPEDFRQKLEAEGGPLSSFSQKIMMGRALAIYGEVMQYNLDLLRHIRNAFAHAHVPITFNTPEIAEAVPLFKHQALLPPYNLGADKQTVPEEPRARFHHACETMSHNLIVWGWRRRETMP